jgi:tetratricopeptide (TPR) repeat protein
MTMATDAPAGTVITFYSYKGGTGRSLALATCAWILAANGQRVLVLDWDLEAPGLHRYFRPFLIDKELISSDGLIDFVSRFADDAVRPLPDDKEPAQDWYLAYADLGPYVLSINYGSFPGGGKLDLVPAGRQDETYATRVNSFDWKDFYTRLGGGPFLDATIAKLRQTYQYILIDSRTGVSDTSGICTAQLPDVLAVCFTYNNQSISGASAVARSAEQERQKILAEMERQKPSAERRSPPAFEPERGPLRIFPVPTRVDQSEQDKLRMRQQYAYWVFGHFLDGLVEPDKVASYWVEVEVPYLAFLSYEEVLPVFTDNPEDQKKPLAAMVRLTGKLTGLKLATGGLVSQDGEREKYLRQYAATPQSEPRTRGQAARAAVGSKDEKAAFATEASLRGNEEFARWRRELQASLSEWSPSAGGRRGLLRGMRLAAATRWLQASGQDLREDEKDFIRASQADAQRRRALHWMSAAVLLAVLAAGGAILLELQLLRASRSTALLQARSLLASGQQDTEDRDYEKALADFDKAIDGYQEAGLDHRAESADAYTGRAVVWARKGDVAAARRDLDKALALRPSDPVALMRTANLERDKGNLQAAIKIYDIALSRQPTDAQLLLNRGIAKLLSGTRNDLESASVDLNGALKGNPDLAEAYLNLGSVDRKLGNTESAIGYLHKAADLATDPAVRIAAETGLSQLEPHPGPGASGPEPSYSVIQPAAVPRVFLHYRDPADAPVVEAVAAALGGARFSVEGKEVVVQPTLGDVRYFYPSDLQNAEAAKSSVEKVLRSNHSTLEKLRLISLVGSYKSVTPGTIEVWLPSLTAHGPFALAAGCQPPFADIATQPEIDRICGIKGAADSYPAQQAQNEAKNNLCATGAPMLVTFADLASLQARVAATGLKYDRENLPARRVLKGLGEGKVVRLVAYVARATYSNAVPLRDGSAGESVNCNLPGNLNNDIHVVLVQAPGDPECSSVTAEVIPHLRPVAWTPAAIKASSKPLRITGQLFFDASHHPCKDGPRTGDPARVSEWEIHPVYDLEVCTAANPSDCKADSEEVWTPLATRPEPARKSSAAN